MLQGKHCTKKACLKENPYERAFLVQCYPFKKALPEKAGETKASSIRLQARMQPIALHSECLCFFAILPCKDMECLGE